MKRILFILFFLFLDFELQASDEIRLKLPPYKRVVMQNGVILLFMEQHEVPVISFSISLRAGSVADPAGKEGLSSVTAGLLRKGTKTRTAEQIAADLDFIGGTMDMYSNYDYTGGAAEFLKKDLAKGLDLLSDTLLHPTFPEAEVKKLIEQSMDEVKAEKDQPQAVIGRYFASYLYGTHPYARPVNGDEKSLAAIHREDIVKFYETYYTPDNLIIAVAGDFQTSDMEKRLVAQFGNWPARKAPAIEFPEPAVPQEKKLLLIDKPDSTQTFYTLGNIGINATNPDRVYIDVVNTFFGGRFTSMLNSELRISSGLTYGASSVFGRRKTKGPFRIMSFTQNATTEKAMDLTLDILKRFHEKGMTQEELDSTKNYMKGQFPTDIETTDQLADLISAFETYGLNESEINDLYAKIDAMTLEDAKRIIDQYFPEKNLVFVLIGKASEIGTVVKKYAPKVDQKSISDPGF